MLTIKAFFSKNEMNEFISTDELVDFLHTHLDNFGDPKSAIKNCVEYAFSKSEGMGGSVLVGYYEGKIVGAVIMNKTGMEGYIPQNILVYVAVDASLRGKGLGRKMIEKALEISDGDVKLHVEHDNPAKRLYERIGFTNKYAEMRFSKEAK
ncbi:MAG: GNAT family N-acetyltransferase [Bacteroidetes bacterium]|nr:GNAT family N-acetyltransferase [Bacteroidota bacterium]